LESSLYWRYTSYIIIIIIISTYGITDLLTNLLPSLEVKKTKSLATAEGPHNELC